MHKRLLQNKPGVLTGKKRRLGRHNGGFTMFFAVLVATLALAVGLAIYSLTARELDLSSVATQSLYAVYAADTGIECAQYWDLKYTCPVGAGTCQSAFATSTSPSSGTPPVPAPAGSQLKCESQDITAPGAPPGGSAFAVNASSTGAATTFSLRFSGVPYCATVQVNKYVGSDGTPRTTVLSYGYNTCANSQTRVERLLQANY